MPLPEDKRINCLSCQYHCEIKSNSTIRMHNCFEDRYAIWPDKNLYLSIGVINRLIKRYHNFTHSGFIFVDFSYYNIREFTNYQWIEALAKSGMRLILISDQIMQPLATFWQQSYEKISCVINVTDDEEQINKKISRAFNGHRDYAIAKNKLTSFEVAVLDLMMSEYSVVQIADFLSVKDKKVYVAKRNLQRKIGGRRRLHSILSI